ncbi:MAG TPA: ornithine carbamoyltransferase [Gemmataceae bacterium]|jgi:ornithine carbamoyltransferase|nr:ornithine carbamoyltransferase [Gemmataceae bacterium]
MRHFLDVLSVNRDELLGLLSEAQKLKAAHQRGEPNDCLTGKLVGLIFEKPSLRTRVSFEAAVNQLGGRSLFLPAQEVGLGWRESVPDFARTMNHYVDALVLRVFKHSTLTTMTQHSTVPLVNGLSDTAHPCQTSADLLTMQEVFGELKGRTVVFVGDGNNVARSLALGCGTLGIRFRLAAPKGYGFDDGFRTAFRKHAPKGTLESVIDPVKAVRDADIIYSDVWTSMGQEEEREKRLRDFAHYQINAKLLAAAPKHAKVMHCLPAHRGEEITDEVVDGERSVVFQQAGNRLHAQKAILAWLLK